MKGIQNFLKKVKFDTIIDYFVQYKRYVGAACVFVVIMLLLAYCTNGTASDSNPMAGVYQKYEECQNQEVKDLIHAYFKDYAAGDVDALKTIATPISDAEASYIQFYSQYVESYENIKIYTKRGIHDQSYLCSVYLEVKFKEIETPVAGLDFFYVDTNEDGKYYINNVYGSFNQANGEFDMDTEISALIAAFEQQSDVLALQAEVQEKCNQAMLADEKLNSFVNTTLQQAISQWATSYKEAVAKAAAEAAAAKAAEEAAAAKAAEEAKAAAEAEAQAAAEEANATMKVTTAKINVRESASETANSLGKVAEGTQVKCYSEENGWTKIDYNGTKAYVKSEFLQAVGGNTDTQATGTSSNSEGRTLLLTQTVNVRENMSETATKVAVAYPGNHITIIKDYAEGWSKVNYEGKEGYCKTELLK